jgi:hypothetical protein
LFPEHDSLAMPDRRPIDSVPGGRRPTVAIVDTGVSSHDWFHSPVADDPILVDASTQGWPGPLVDDPAYTWHGTFVAGLVRYMSADARILSVQLHREAGDNGGVADGQILDALTWLRDRTAPDPCPDFVDVICLAIGYREEPREHYTEEVGAVIRELCGRGVLMVMAAGNRSNPVRIPDASTMAGKEQPPPDLPVFPGALAKDGLMDGLPFVPVGATMPDGSLAPFSVDESWVKHREMAYDVISTVPMVDPWWTTLIASVTDRNRTEGFARGFAHGSGTSFAAATFAGRMAAALLDDHGPSAGSGVADTGRAAAIERTKRALDAARNDA